jgi:hypothetical protein
MTPETGAPIPGRSLPFDKNVGRATTGEKAMAKIQIMGAPFSSYVWVVRMVCEERGVPVREDTVSWTKPTGSGAGPGEKKDVRYGATGTS